MPTPLELHLMRTILDTTSARWSQLALVVDPDAWHAHEDGSVTWDVQLVSTLAADNRGPFDLDPGLVVPATVEFSPGREPVLRHNQVTYRLLIEDLQLPEWGMVTVAGLADLLSVSRSTIHRRIKRVGIRTYTVPTPGPGPKESACIMWRDVSAVTGYTLHPAGNTMWMTAGS